MRIKLFEGFSRYPQYTEQELRSGISDCLVELNDLGDFEYEIDIDLNDNYICVVVNSGLVSAPEEYSIKRTFDSLELTEPILLLENYIYDKFDRIIKDYWFCNINSIETFGEFPTQDDMDELYEDGEYERADSVFKTERLIIKFIFN